LRSVAASRWVDLELGRCFRSGPDARGNSREVPIELRHHLIVTYMLQGPAGASYGPFDTKDELLSFEEDLDPDEGPYWIEDLSKTKKISKSDRHERN